MHGVAVKICGLTQRTDAELAAAAGAEYVGTVLALGSPRRVSAETAARVGGGLPCVLVCVFVNEPPDAVVAQASVAGAQVIQLHGEESAADVVAVRESGGWRVWKAVRLRDADEWPRAAERYAPVADGILVEGWDAKVQGGGALRFAWDRVAAERDAVPSEVDLIVAGGLTPDNVADAIGLLRPDVVDVSSGVERAPGRKDPLLIQRFVAAARAARAGTR